MRYAALAIVLALALAAGLALPPSGRAAQPAVTVPPLTGETLAGANLFTRYCAVCHGAVGDGTDKGPPLIHRVYEPGHHSDVSFVIAVRQGVRAHHWRFGDMPPVDGVGDEEIARIIAFVRAVQRANGIE